MTRNLDIKLLAIDTQQWSSCAEDDHVLPYYQWAFEVLNPEQEYMSCYGYQNDVREKLCDVLRSLCPELAPDYYYDLRSWDDFSCAAPQYLTLDTLGWRKTSPLSFRIRGCDDLPRALELFCASSHQGDTAAVTILERSGIQYRLIGLLLEKCAGPEQTSNR